jgi:hypothetical protein
MNTPFVYANAGINFRAITTEQKRIQNISSTAPGFYYDAGIGWKLKIKHERAILLSAGYTLKQVQHKSKTFWGAPTPQLQELNYDRYNFLYRRVVCKIAIQL